MPTAYFMSSLNYYTIIVGIGIICNATFCIRLYHQHLSSSSSAPSSLLSPLLSCEEIVCNACAIISKTSPFDNTVHDDCSGNLDDDDDNNNDDNEVGGGDLFLRNLPGGVR